MGYYILSPEVAGSIFGPNSIVDMSVHPPKVSRLNYEFDDWLGDDLLEDVGTYIVTARLKQALTELSPTGCTFDTAEVSKSERFNEMCPDQELPQFAWLKIVGRAGANDFGMSDDYRLIVSERVMRCLSKFKMNNCIIEKYMPHEQLASAALLRRRVI